MNIKWAGKSGGLAVSQGIARWEAPCRKHSWQQLGVALRKLKLRVPVLLQPAEIVLHLENKTDEKRGL